MACSEVVLLAGGVSVELAVLLRVLDLEGRGVRFTLLDRPHFRVDPVDLLTDDDIEFLRNRRDEARRVIAYEAPQCA